MDEFLAELTAVAPAAGRGDYAFAGQNGDRRGFVQIIVNSDRQVTIHRLWTPEPGAGNGAIMLRVLCDLADRHGIELKLRPLPFGRKPYPMKRDQLLAWYQRHGFAGTHRKMIRPPLGASITGPAHQLQRPR